ncbi:MAG TPA: SRPBCC family protein [Candidatus Baltobacteraceae bacterium]
MERSTQHATFVIERTYDATPARVFRAFADPAAKTEWFNGPDGWERRKYALDFRVGGHEISSVGPPGGPAHIFEASFHDIVPNERITFSYTMDIGETRLSASVTTIELKGAGTGTQLRFTEQGVFFDGHEDPEIREHGTGELLKSLERALRAQPANV